MQRRKLSLSKKSKRLSSTRRLATSTTTRLIWAGARFHLILLQISRPPWPGSSLSRCQCVSSRRAPLDDCLVKLIPPSKKRKLSLSSA